MLPQGRHGVLLRGLLLRTVFLPRRKATGSKSARYTLRRVALWQLRRMANERKLHAESRKQA